jgi:hypothetical protein
VRGNKLSVLTARALVVGAILSLSEVMAAAVAICLLPFFAFSIGSELLFALLGVAVIVDLLRRLSLSPFHAVAL